MVAKKITPAITKAVAEKVNEVIKENVSKSEARISEKMLEWDGRMRKTIQEIVNKELGPLVDKKLEERLGK